MRLMKVISRITVTLIVIGIIVIRLVPVTMIRAEDLESEELEISAKSAVIMETSTGNIIYEKNADEQLPPASVTKIMTLILIFEAIDKGEISLENTVVVSEYAASMGGSQIFLEVGEQQTVDTMIKSIIVASANDACVAMAEFIEGTEAEFVNQMNIKADEIGMINTYFVNCNGLDTEGHLTTARDIALMSRELVGKHPEIEKYTMIWMEDITHVTSKGSTIFGLSNTNKLVKAYPHTTGLKTGSTDEAKFCISATARKDEIDMIAVVMGAPTSQERTTDAIAMLDYGFSKCQKYIDTEDVKYSDIEISKGTKDTAIGYKKQDFSYIDTEDNDLNGIEKRVTYLDKEILIAPIEEGCKVGTIQYLLDGKEIGTLDLIAYESIEAMSFGYAIRKILPIFLL